MTWLEEAGIFVAAMEIGQYGFFGRKHQSCSRIRLGNVRDSITSKSKVAPPFDNRLLPVALLEEGKYCTSVSRPE